MLLLKRHLVELVRIGRKRQTIRLWTRPMLRAGQISYTPGLGRMKITAVDTLPALHALTEADAHADGFDSLPDLLAEITRIYGNNPAGRTLFRIRFDWPIDAAGEKLLLAPPAQTPAARRPIPATSAPTKHARMRRMTGPEREKLRSFVLAHTPR